MCVCKEKAEEQFLSQGGRSPPRFPRSRSPRKALRLGCGSLLERAPPQGMNCFRNGNDPTLQLTGILAVSTLWMRYMLANIYAGAGLQISPLRYDLSMLICHYYFRCQTFPRSSMEKPEGLKSRSQTPKSLTFHSLTADIYITFLALDLHL